MHQVTSTCRWKPPVQCLQPESHLLFWSVVWAHWAHCLQQSSEVTFSQFRLLLCTIIWPNVRHNIFHSWMWDQNIQESSCQVRHHVLRKAQNFELWCFCWTCLSYLFTAKTPTIKVWGSGFCFSCSLSFFIEAFTLSLLVEGRILFRVWHGDPESCDSGANMCCSCTLGCWGSLLLILPVAAVHGCFLIGKVDEAFLPGWQCRPDPFC